MSDARIPPLHPGHYLRELLEELGLSQYQLAKAVGVSAMRVSHIIHERRPVTAEMAIRLGLFFDQSPQYWMNLQTRYDMDVAMETLGERLSREISPLQAERVT